MPNTAPVCKQKLMGSSMLQLLLIEITNPAVSMKVELVFLSKQVQFCNAIGALDRHTTGYATYMVAYCCASKLLRHTSLLSCESAIGKLDQRHAVLMQSKSYVKVTNAHVKWQACPCTCL